MDNSTLQALFYIIAIATMLSWAILIIAVLTLVLRIRRFVERFTSAKSVFDFLYRLSRLFK